MSNPWDHDSPAASNGALDLVGPRCSNVNFDQKLALMSAQPPNSATSYDRPFLLSPSSGFADEPINPPSGYPSSWNSGSTSGFGHSSVYGQSSTLDNPLANSGQPLSVYHENADLTPGIGQSTASDAFEATGQQQSSFGASVDELFQVSFALESDLEKLSDIHARASIGNLLACCTIRKPKEFLSHLELGRFYYGQAFAAETGAVVLKVTNQVSGEILGCAWLQVHLSLEKHNIRVPICRPGVSLPSCLKRTIYGWIYHKAHNHRRRAVKEGTQNYFLFVSEFELERDVFVRLRKSHISDMRIFVDAGWEFTGYQVLNNCPKDLVFSLRNCPIEDRTLIGLLRAGLVKARAESQTSLSHAWPSPVAEVWPPRSLPLTTNPAICGDLDEFSPKEQQDHDSGRASNKRAGSGEVRKAQQQVAVSEEQGPSSAQFDQQTLAGQQPPPWTETPQQPVGTPQSYQSRIPPNEQYGQPQLGQSQQPDNQTISAPQESPAPYPTITVNFLADGTQIFERPTHSVPASFNYIPYREVSTAMTVNDLISKLRLENAMLKGVTVTFEMIVGDGWSALRKWGAGMTILQGSEMAEWTLAEVGWGPEASPVWVAVKM